MRITNEKRQHSIDNHLFGRDVIDEENSWLPAQLIII